MRQFRTGSYTNHVATKVGGGFLKKPQHYIIARYLFSKSGYVRGRGGQNSEKMATWFVYGP